MFNYDSSTEEISSVEFVTSIVSITVIIKFTKSVFAVLDENVPNPSVTIKKPLNVFLSNVIR